MSTARTASRLVREARARPRCRAGRGRRPWYSPWGSQPGRQGRKSVNWRALVPAAPAPRCPGWRAARRARGPARAAVTRPARSCPPALFRLPSRGARRRPRCAARAAPRAARSSGPGTPATQATRRRNLVPSQDRAAPAAPAGDPGDPRPGGGSLDRAEVGSRFFEFWPGNAEPVGRYAWDITEHTKTAGWLAWLFLRAEVRAAGSTLVVHGRDACRSTCARRQGLVQPAQAGAVASRLAGGDVRPRLPGALASGRSCACRAY